MRPASIDRTEPPPSPFSLPVQRWLERGRGWLSLHRPRLGDPRFWAIQGLILAIAGLHAGLEALEILELVSPFGHGLAYVPISLFFVPVVYAALRFGSSGSVPTAIWCTLLAVPNVLFFHHGVGRVGEVFQIGMVDVIAVIAGQRVDLEIGARQRAEAASAACRASEMKYRALFESSPAAILVIDPTGIVREANPAAGLLFGKGLASLKGTSVARLLGADGAEQLLGTCSEDTRAEADLVLARKDGSEVQLEPTLTPINNGQGEPAIQVLLRDVTEERQRHAGLRAYAARVLRAQEEERTRIARELHDETVQKLVLLCRQLDCVESTSGPLPPLAVAGLGEARRSAEEVVEELRDFARALRPPTLDDLGLVTAIRRLLGDLSERAKTEVKLKLVGEERRLPPDVELGLFRIAQQALRNVEHHARASRVTATMNFADGKVRLDVLDNGVGFALPAGLDLAATGYLGLLGMRERAEALGGTLTIRSTPGRGTRLNVSVPIEDLPEAPPHRRPNPADGQHPA